MSAKDKNKDSKVLEAKMYFFNQDLTVWQWGDNTYSISIIQKVLHSIFETIERHESKNHAALS